MMTDRQEWFLLKLLNQLEEKDEINYDINWQTANLAFACNEFSVYRTSKKEASHDIQTCLDELKKFN